MSNTYTSVCIRCGKERIILKSWSETRETRAGNATISFTSMVCPDPECQKIVDSTFETEKNKRVEAQRVKLLEDAARKRASIRAKTRLASVK